MEIHHRPLFYYYNVNHIHKRLLVAPWDPRNGSAYDAFEIAADERALGGCQTELVFEGRRENAIEV